MTKLSFPIFPVIGLLLLSLLLTACAPTGSDITAGEMRYATLLQMEHRSGYIVVEASSPSALQDGGEGLVKQRYFLVPRDSAVPAALVHEEGAIIRTPVRRVAATSTVHATLLQELSADIALVGLCDTAYVVSAPLRAALRRGDIADLGNSFAPNHERVIAAQPDLLITSDLESSARQALAAAGIPLAVCMDYMETTPLGRAEWMKLFGALTGQEATAADRFAAVEAAYDSLRALTANVTTRPRLLIDLPRSDAWVTPAGDSYLGQMYADAGANYLFADYGGSGSVEVSNEVAYTRADTADLWLIKYGGAVDYSTYAQLQRDYGRLQRLVRPWQQRHVYGCNTSRVAYFDEVPFHPDRLLRDFIHIFHPNLLPTHTLRYFQPLRD